MFFGHKVFAVGISPDGRKVDAVKQARPPHNVSELRSFLALPSYCARFIPHFSTIAEPLRQLTKMRVKWSWTTVQQKAFEQVKFMLTSDCVMSHFDPSVETQLKVVILAFSVWVLSCHREVEIRVELSPTWSDGIHRRKEKLSQSFGRVSGFIFTYMAKKAVHRSQSIGGGL